MTPQQLIERVAEAIWLAEGKRVLGRRAVSWTEISEEDRERYRFVASEIIPVAREERK